MASNSNPVPIRAPPTLDDSEFDVSSNSTLSESEFEEEEFPPLLQLRVTPFAHLSTCDDEEAEDEDEDETEEEEEEEEETLRVVYAPEEENAKACTLIKSLPVSQSLLQDDVAFYSDIGSDDEHCRGIRVAYDEDEHSSLSHSSLDGFNSDQFGNARVAFDDSFENLGLDCSLQQNSQVHCIVTGEPVANASAENVELIITSGFVSESDRESEPEDVVSAAEILVNSKDELHDSSSVGLGFNDGSDDCEGDEIRNVESSEPFDPVSIQECAYLGESLSNVSQEEVLFLETLDLGDIVREEATVELSTATQDSKRDGSASDGDDAAELMPVDLEQFREQISALSVLLGPKGSGKTSQEELAIRSSHGTMNLLTDDDKSQLVYSGSSCESDGSTDIVSSPDESSVVFHKNPASTGSLPYYDVQAGFQHNITEDEKQKIQNILSTSVKFSRLIQRINLSLEDSLVSKVLCRLVADIGMRSNQELVINSAKMLAMKLEENCQDDLDFSLNILVLGRSGVGKSATINSIFGDMKVLTNAFEPATHSVKEVSGTIDGVRLRILDTPGLKSHMKEQAYNRKILSSIKRYMKKFSPDVILYVDRVDAQTRDLNDLPILRSITSFLTPSIWQHAILTLTHAASDPLDGPSGSPLSYEAFVAQKSCLVQQSITQAVGGMCQLSPSFMCPVALVDNQPLCEKNMYGDSVLPNGLRWRSQLLALCFSLKILSEVSSVSGSQTLFDHWKHFFFQDHSQPVSHVFSSLLQSPAHLKFSANWN